MRLYVLRDGQWVRNEDLLPGRIGHVGMTARDNRLFVEAELHRYPAGIPWRDLPERFGSRKAVWMPPVQWTSGTISPAGSSTATTSPRCGRRAS